GAGGVPDGGPHPRVPRAGRAAAADALLQRGLRRPAADLAPAVVGRPRPHAPPGGRLHHRRPPGGAAPVTSTVPAGAAARAARPPGEGRRPAPFRSDRVRAEGRLGWWLAGPAFVVMLAVTAYPILQAVYESLFSFRLTAPDERRFVGLGNYAV